MLLLVWPVVVFAACSAWLNTLKGNADYLHHVLHIVQLGLVLDHSRCVSMHPDDPFNGYLLAYTLKFGG